MKVQAGRLLHLEGLFEQVVEGYEQEEVQKRSWHHVGQKEGQLSTERKDVQQPLHGRYHGLEAVVQRCAQEKHPDLRAPMHLLMA